MNSQYQIILTFLTSLTICYMAIPSIIKVAEIKLLYDEPCDRKRHLNKIPTLGGIAIFAGSIISITFWSNQGQIVELQYIIASLLILFFMGIKDDIVNLVAHKKLLGQLLAASTLVFLADIRLTSLYGLFEIYHLSYSASAVLSLFAIIGITNAFNLIDGIDLLAASIGSLVATTFGVWFYLADHIQYSIVSFSLLGSLIAFANFNRPPAKIFMGDTGSLVLGLIASVLAIKFIEFNRSFTGNPNYKILSVPAVAISVLIIPIFDTCRVFLLRVLQGKSPLAPDRNHLHHILTDIGYSHPKSTGILILINISILFITYRMQMLQGEMVLFLITLIMISITFLFNRIRRKKRHQEQAYD